MSSKFGLPESLLDAVRNIQKEETEYQAKVKALMKKKGITSMSQLSPDEKKAFFNQLDAMHKAKNEEVELEEGKSGTGYELYHKDFSSAMSHAYDFAKKKYGIEVDPSEIDRNVAMGPKKPSSGKANAYRLLDKTGKKAIQVQVTNLDNKRYELNMYKEDLDLEESGGPVVYKKGDDHIEKYGDEKFAVYKNGKKTKYYKSMDDAKAALKEEGGASKKKEDEFHTKLDKLVHKTFGHSSDEKKMKKEERDPPFTPDKPKKNPGVVPGKHGAGPSIAKHLAKMAMKKQQEKKPVKEASSPAQQAAIAIAMKKAGKKPKDMKEEFDLTEASGTSMKDAKSSQDRANLAVQSAKMQARHASEREALKRKREALQDETNLEEAFSASQIDKMRQEYGKIKGIDPASDNYKKLTAMLDKLDTKTLQSLAGAKIKFVSPLAQNRVVRRMNEEKTVGAKKEATGNEKPVKKGEKVSGKKEPITIDPEVDEKK